MAINIGIVSETRLKIMPRHVNETLLLIYCILMSARCFPQGVLQQAAQTCCNGSGTIIILGSDLGKYSKQCKSVMVWWFVSMTSNAGKREFRSHSMTTWIRVWLVVHIVQYVPCNWTATSPIQSVVCLLPGVSCDRFQPSLTLNAMSGLKKWMDEIIYVWLFLFFLFFDINLK